MIGDKGKAEHEARKTYIFSCKRKGMKGRKRKAW